MIDFNNKIAMCSEIKQHARRQDYVRAAYFMGIMQCIHGVDSVPVEIVQVIIGATWHKVDYNTLNNLMCEWQPKGD
jgi:hypothetical protein